MIFEVYLKGGITKTNNVGKVPDVIQQDQQAMFNLMLNILVSEGINPYDIYVVKTKTNTVTN